MALTIQVRNNTNFDTTEYTEKNTIDTLYVELAKGIQSMKNDESYTIDEAWEVIDKI